MPTHFSGGGAAWPSIRHATVNRRVGVPRMRLKSAILLSFIAQSHLGVEVEGIEMERSETV